MIEWKAITKDEEVLQAIVGFKIPFKDGVLPFQVHEPKERSLSDNDSRELKFCISKLLDFKAISVVEPCKHQFVSTIFVVPKSDGSGRFIINLKSLNEFLDSPHFKMEDHRTVTKILERNDYLAKIDLKDAYYLIPVYEDHKKFLRFRFQNTLYQFNCLPFGLSCAPRLFTKVIRPVVNHLRSRKNRSVVFLDDFLLLGNSFNKCVENVNCTVELLTKLGLTINFQKSIFVPNQSIEYLGFLFNSAEQSVSLPQRKRDNLISNISSLIKKDTSTILCIAKLVGSLVAASPAVPYSMLYTRRVEKEKQHNLFKNNNCFEASMRLSAIAKKDLEWWLMKLPSAKTILREDVIDYRFDSDSSLTGWGCNFNGKKARGFWGLEEQGMHINTLELLAVLNGLNCFFKSNTNCHILVRLDSTTALCYINRLGGCRSDSNHKVAECIWKWCEERNIWLSATYINTHANYLADSASREKLDDNDFYLDSASFLKIVQNFGDPAIDLFASHKTNKCKRFISWYPDPKSEAVDAFTVSWSEYFYAFPPFALIHRVLKKIISEKAMGIVVVPQWKAQSWYPTYCSLLVKNPIILKRGKYTLCSPYDSRLHPLVKSMDLVVGILSGDRAAYQKNVVRY